MSTFSAHCREAETGLWQSREFVGMKEAAPIISLGKSESVVVG